MSQTTILETAVPHDIYLTLQSRGLYREVLADQSKRLLAIRFYQDRILSLGQSARLAGMRRWDFIELLGKYQVPVIDYTPEELEAEFKASDQLMKSLSMG